MHDYSGVHRCNIEPPVNAPWEERRGTHVVVHQCSASSDAAILRGFVQQVAMLVAAIGWRGGADRGLLRNQ